MVPQGDRGKTGAPGPPGEMGPMVRSKSGPCLSYQGIFHSIFIWDGLWSVWRDQSKLIVFEKSTYDLCHIVCVRVTMDYQEQREILDHKGSQYVHSQHCHTVIYTECNIKTALTRFHTDLCLPGTHFLLSSLCALFLQWHSLNKLEDLAHWLLILMNSPLLIVLPEKHCDCLSPICQPCIHNYSRTREIRISKQDFWSVSVRSL